MGVAEATDACERALALARTRRTVLEGEPLMLTGLARAQLGRGDPARASAEEAVGPSVARNLRAFEGMARYRLARVLLASEGTTAAGAVRSGLRRALTLLHETGMRSYEPHVHAALAELDRVVGDDAAAENELRQARQLCKDIGARPDAIRPIDRVSGGA